MSKIIRKTIFVFIFIFIFFASSIFAFIFTFNMVFKIISSPLVYVPKLEGSNLKDAVVQTGKLDLILKIEKEVHNSDLPDGYIISQDPPYGRTVREGADIKIIIASSTMSEKVPNVIGLSQVEAENILENKSIKIAKRSFVYDDRLENGIVISQFPPPDSSLDRESGASLLISKGKKTLTMPPLYHLDIEEAEYILSLLGVEIKDVKHFLQNTGIGGEVIYQNIVPGDTIKKGDSVILGVLDNDNSYKSGDYQNNINFAFIVPGNFQKVKVKIILRDDQGDNTFVDNTFTSGDIIHKKIKVMGISKVYISLDSILYEIRRVN